MSERLTELLVLEPDGRRQLHGDHFGRELRPAVRRPSRLPDIARGHAHRRRRSRRALHARVLHPSRPAGRTTAARRRPHARRPLVHDATGDGGEPNGPIFVLSASFAVERRGRRRLAAAGPTDVTPPEAIDPATSFRVVRASTPFEVLSVHTGSPTSHPCDPPLVGARAAAAARRSLVHACMLTFFSDMGVVGSARAPTSTASESLHGRQPRPRRLVPPSGSGRRLDPVLGRADVERRCPRPDRGAMHTRDGVLVASIAQEALLRDTGRVPLP